MSLGNCLTEGAVWKPVTAEQYTVGRRLAGGIFARSMDKRTWHCTTQEVAGRYRPETYGGGGFLVGTYNSLTCFASLIYARGPEGSFVRFDPRLCLREANFHCVVTMTS